MLNCQLCGACSWGPARFEANLADLAQKTGAAFLQCDNCNSIARKDLVDSPAIDITTPHLGGPLFPPPFDPVASASQLLKGIIPEKAPESRTERLVRAFMSPWGCPDGVADIESVAVKMVMLARAVEKELDLVGVADQTGAPGDDLEETAELRLKPRDFQTDFLLPAFLGLDTALIERVGLALDCAIAFGALESLTGNQSLQEAGQVDSAYWEKVGRLKAMSS